MDKTTIVVAIVTAVIASGVVIKTVRKAPAFTGMALLAVVVAGMFVMDALK